MKKMTPKKKHRGKLPIINEYPELGFGQYLITFSQGGTSPRYMRINEETGKTSGFIKGTYAENVLSGYQLLKASPVGKILGDFSPLELRKLSLTALQNNSLITSTETAQKTLEEQIAADPTVAQLLGESEYHLVNGNIEVGLAYSANQRSVKEALKYGLNEVAVSLLTRSLGIRDFGRNYQRTMGSKVMTPQQAETTNPAKSMEEASKAVPSIFDPTYQGPR